MDGRLVVVVGGSGFYSRYLVEDLLCVGAEPALRQHVLPLVDDLGRALMRSSASLRCCSTARSNAGSSGGRVLVRLGLLAGHLGRFDHFFPSKDALGLAVLEANWAMMTALLEQAFSAEVEPLERIDRFVRGFGGMLAMMGRQMGATPGCPLGNLVAELSAQQGEVRTRITGILDAWAG